MTKFIRLIDKTSFVAGVIAGAMMLIGVLLVLTEIIVRALFDSTLYITEEYSAYIMVAITFLGLAYTLKEKGHIRMVFLHKFIKGKARNYLDLYAYIVGFIVFALITITTTNFFLDSLTTGSRSMQISKTYLAIPQSLMPLGSLLVSLQLAAEALKTMIRIQKGEMPEDETDSQELGR